MQFPQRKLHRLKSWDYSQNGFYYITICTKNRRKWFCEIQQNGTDASVEPTTIGKIAMDNWFRLPHIYPNVKLDVFCLMPNHIHAIIIIDNGSEKQGPDIPYIIRGYKSVVSREFNKRVPGVYKNALWQDSYFDEIIRNDEMLENTRRYIAGNPSKWLEDSLYIE